MSRNRKKAGGGAVETGPFCTAKPDCLRVGGNLAGQKDGEKERVVVPKSHGILTKHGSFDLQKET